MPLMFISTGGSHETLREVGPVAITGLGLGHILSYAVLANQGHKNKILTPEEYQQLKEKCDAGDDTFDFEVV